MGLTAFLPLTQSLQLLSIGGAFLVGFWLPIRLIGYAPPVALEICFDLLVSLVAGVNIALYFKQPYKEIRRRDSWINLGLWLDLVCLLPLSLFAFLIFNQTVDGLLVLNLLCARHVRQIKPFLDYFDSLQPMTYRLFPIFLALPLLVHVVACGWIALGSGTAGIDPDPVLTYVKAIYWSFTTLTTVGYGDISAKSMPQMFYSCGVQVIGVGVFGFILSNVASLISRSDAKREHHMDNLDKIETFMRTHHIPVQLRAKTRSYYHYLWQNKNGYQDRSLLEDLPTKLQGELLYVVNRSIVEKVPFLQNADQEMIEELMFHLEPKVFMPGERIFKAGDMGDSLYFIHTGQVQILSADGQPIAQLNDGAFFGEMALLTDKPRSATAISLSFCDAHVLHRANFEAVAAAHPDFKHHIHAVMSDRKNA